MTNMSTELATVARLQCRIPDYCAKAVIHLFPFRIRKKELQNHRIHLLPLSNQRTMATLAHICLKMSCLFHASYQSKLYGTSGQESGVLMFLLLSASKA